MILAILALVGVTGWALWYREWCVRGELAEYAASWRAEVFKHERNEQTRLKSDVLYVPPKVRAPAAEQLN